MTLEALPVVHADVHGKVQHYIKITNGINVQFINVGVTTYNKVVELQTDDTESANQLKLEIDGTDQKEGNTERTGTEREEQEKLEGIRQVRGPGNRRSDK